MTFDVLSPLLNPFASCFLEASAGTGKTFAIEHIVARLIIEGDTPFLLEEILVVTFTRAATRDLKFRIHRNLKKIQEQLINDTISVDYVQMVVDRQGKKEVLNRLELALLSYEQSAIYTLHSFCFRMLKEFSFESGHVVQAEAAQGAIEEWIASLLKDKTFLEPYSPFQLQKLLQAHQRNPKKWISTLSHWLLSSHPIEPTPSYAEILEKFNEALAGMGELLVEKVSADLSYLASHYTKLPQRKLEGAIALLANAVTSFPCTQETFDQLLEEEILLEGMTLENIKKRGPSLDPDKLYYPGLLEKMQKELLPFLQQAQDVPALMLHLIARIQEKSISFFEDNGLFLPDQILLKMKEAVAAPLFVQKIQERFKAAIIDEFQDTDPVQWAIIRALFSSSILYLVGDPKQSIYAFRNADVYVYLDAKNTIGQENVFQLDTNYRSSCQLVEALNTLFKQAGSEWMSLPSVEQALEVVEVKAGAEILALTEETPVVCMLASCKKGRSRKFPSKELLNTQVFPYIAEEILSLHRRHHIPFHKMAVLIKDRFEGQELLQYLQSCHIPAHMQKGILITETESYLSLKEILRAVYHPHNLSLIKAALVTPLLGWNLIDVGGTNTNEALLKAKERFQRLNTLLFQEGFGAFFYELLPEKASCDALRLLEIILTEEAVIQGKYLEYLERLEFDVNKDNPLFQVSSPEQKDSINLLTIHRSKGLEFEIVFALGLAGRSPVPDILAVRKEEGIFLSSRRCERSLAEIDAEKMRLLYVALTRAKQKVYLPLFIQEEADIKAAQASAAELFLTHLLGQTPSYEQALHFFDPLAPLIRVDCLKEKSPPRYEPSYQEGSVSSVAPAPCFMPRPLLSFSSLARKSPSLYSGHAKNYLRVPLAQQDVLSIHSMPKGASTGVLIHHLLEQIFKKGLHHPLDISSIERLILYELKGTPLEPWLPLFPEWIRRLFTKRLGDFSLSDIPLGQLFYETPFLYTCKQGVMKGFADLFFSFKGYYYILDWKTNVLEDYSQEMMKKAIEEHEYDLQAMIYKEALKSYVKLFDKRPFDSCFGGALYYFIRGEACHVISL